MGSVVAYAIATPLRVASQQPNRLPRVALVYGNSLADIAGADPPDSRARAFVHALRDLGLVEGRNILIERRAPEGRPERLPALMQEVVGTGVDVIVTFGGPGVTAAQRATDRIPIVGVVDAVLDTGLIDSLARPGRNLTGIGENSAAIHGKRLQILKETAPAISRVAVFTYRPLSGPRARWRVETDTAAAAIALDVLWLGVNTPEDVDAAFSTIVREHADALYVLSTYVTHPQRERIADFAIKQHLSSIGSRDGVTAGMLLSYEADNTEEMRRAAVMVKKILDGTKPADLPFEQPTKYSLVINLKTAKALGITIPQSLLLRADEVIR